MLQDLSPSERGTIHFSLGPLSRWPYFIVIPTLGDNGMILHDATMERAIGLYTSFYIRWHPAKSRALLAGYPHIMVLKLSSGMTRSILWLLILWLLVSPDQLHVTMVLTMQGKQVLVFLEDGFQLPQPPECWEIMENARIFYVFQNKFCLNVNSFWPSDVLWCHGP